jgi:hypothetical protein
MEGVDQLLGRCVWHDADLVRQRCPERSEGLQDPFPGLECPVIADDNPRDWRGVPSGRVIQTTPEANASGAVLVKSR